jgi:hypothetical protein
MVFEIGVKNIQAAAYNGARTVLNNQYLITSMKFYASNSCFSFPF